MNERLFSIGIAFTGLLVLLEFVAGFFSHSLALLGDAAYLLTQTVADLVILATLPAHDHRRTRPSRHRRWTLITAASVNALVCSGASIYVVLETSMRLATPARVSASGMLVVAVLAVVFDFAVVRALAGPKHGARTPVGAFRRRAAMWRALSIFVAALLIQDRGWVWLDSLLGTAFSVGALPRVWDLLWANVDGE